MLGHVKTKPKFQQLELLKTYKVVAIDPYHVSRLTESNEVTIINESILTDEQRDLFSVASYNEIKRRGYVPTKGQKIYVDSGCDIKRSKVRNWAKTNEMSLVTKPSDADIIFITHDFLYYKTDSAYSYAPLNVGAYREFVRNNTEGISSDGKYFNEDTGNRLLELMKGLDDDEFVLSYGNITSGSCVLYLRTTRFYDYDIREHRSINVVPYRHTLSEVSLDKKGLSTTSIRPKHKAIYVEVMKSPEKLRDIATLNQLVNEEMMTIDKEMFKQLDAMLSGSTQDKILAMEIMANCNLKESIYYLLLLLAEHARSIEDLKEASHVNFKSMLKFCGFKTIKRVWIDFDYILKTTMNHGVMTYEHLQATAEKVKSKASVPSKYFKVKTIEVTEDIIDYFQKSKDKRK